MRAARVASVQQSNVLAARAQHSPPGGEGDELALPALQLCEALRELVSDRAARLIRAAAQSSAIALPPSGQRVLLLEDALDVLQSVGFAAPSLPALVDPDDTGVVPLDALHALLDASFAAASSSDEPSQTVTNNLLRQLWIDSAPQAARVVAAERARVHHAGVCATESASQSAPSEPCFERLYRMGREQERRKLALQAQRERENDAAFARTHTFAPRITARSASDAHRATTATADLSHAEVGERSSQQRAAPAQQASCAQSQVEYAFVLELKLDATRTVREAVRGDADPRALARSIAMAHALAPLQEERVRGVLAERLLAFERARWRASPCASKPIAPTP
jgi:hypothetical protein